MRKYHLHIAWLIAVMAVLITLFSSEFYNVPVCELCWYQRICIYPLAVMLGIAAYCDDHRGILKYALPLSILAFLFGLYHYLQQMVPGFAPIELCGVESLVSCSLTHFKWLGFISYPFLSMLASALITAALLLGPKASSVDDSNTTGDNP